MMCSPPPPQPSPVNLHSVAALFIIFHLLTGPAAERLRRTYYEAGRFLPISVGWRAVLGWVEPRNSLPPFTDGVQSPNV